MQVDYDFILLFRTEEDDLYAVVCEVDEIKSLYFELGMSLGLKFKTLKAIDEKYRPTCNSKMALNEVLISWLNKEYNSEKFGPPTWKLLVENVDRVAQHHGSNDKLAMEIAQNHPKPAKG